MSPHRWLRLPLACTLPALLIACGGDDQILNSAADPRDTGLEVTPFEDVAADTAAPDVAADTAAPDVAADTAAPDVAADPAAPDVAADTVAPDVAADTAAPDVAADTAAPDVAADTAAPDVAADTAAPDVAADTTPDASIDAEADVPPEVAQVDWCRLQFPLRIDGVEGDEVLVFVRLYEDGLTNLTAGNDLRDGLVGEFGVGADGTEPDATWSWQSAAPNDAYTEGSEPGNDEWFATFTLPEPGVYDYAFRFQLEADGPYTLCDGPGGPGSDGAENGYQTALAGDAVVTAPPLACEPNPCTTPPEDACSDATTAVRYAAEGACFDTDGTPSCEYASESVACADGQTCSAGVCSAVAPVTPTFCRLQFPLSSVIAPGDGLLFYTRFYAEGLTDVSPTTDPYPSIVSQVGIGPEIDPSTDAAVWTWFDQAVNEAYDGNTFGEPNNDEYVGEIVFDEPAIWRVAARVSGDGGATWLYCDGQDAGSSDGVQIENLGVVTVEPPA